MCFDGSDHAECAHVCGFQGSVPRISLINVRDRFLSNDCQLSNGPRLKAIRCYYSEKGCRPTLDYVLRSCRYEYVRNMDGLETSSNFSLIFDTDVGLVVRLAIKKTVL